MPTPVTRRLVPPYLGQVLREDRGSVSAELVIATPLLLLMLLGIVQFALWSHATHVAQAAAAQGLAVVRAQDATAAQGRAAAQQMIDQLGHGPLTDIRIEARRDATTAAVQIHGTATVLIPFLRLPVRAEASGPRELFLTDPPPAGELTRP